MTRPIPLLCTLAMLLPGCAYQAAMKRGETAAAEARYADAFKAYEFAHDTNGKAEAQDGMSRAIGMQLEQARSLAVKGEFEAGFDLLEQAEMFAPEDERTKTTREEMRAMLVERLGEFDEGDDLHEHYAFAATAKRLIPTSWEVENALATIRESVVKDANEKREAKQWTEAREVAANLMNYEPEHKTLADELDVAIVTDWVGDLTARADKLKKVKPGLSAVLYARAHEVGEDPEHLATARTLYTEAGETGSVAVYVESEGSGGRHWTLRKSVKGAVEEMEGTRQGYSSSNDLRAKIYTNTESCSEAQDKERMSKDYISGTRQVPNPEHAELTEKVSSADRDRKKADVQVEKLTKEHKTAADKLSGLEGKHSEAKQEFEAAERALGITRTQFDQSKMVKEEAQKEVDMWKSRDDQAGLEAANKSLASASEIHQDWTSKLEADVKKESEARKAFNRLDEEVVPLRAKVESLAAQLKDAEDAQTAANSEHAALTAKLEDTPKTLTEDVETTLFYDKVTWTMTCTVNATVYFSTGWSTDLDKKQKFTSERETTDVAIKGHEKAEVAEDKKEYPKSKKELVEELNAEAHKEIVAAIDQFVAEYYSKTSRDALNENDDVDAGTDTLVRLFSASKERLEPQTRDQAVLYVKTNHGLQNYAFLDPTFATTTAPPEDETADEEGEAEGEAEAEETATEGEEATEETDGGARAEAPKKAESDSDNPWGG